MEALFSGNGQGFYYPDSLRPRSFTNLMTILIAGLSLLLGGLGAYTIKSCAVRWGLVDRPNDRSSHSRPTPKGGGIGILGAFVVAAWTLHLSYAFWLPAFLISLVSLVSDRLDFSPKIRLPLQFCAALIFIWGCHPESYASLFLYFVAVIFIVGTANWYNFMDGINGIAAITGLIAFGFLSYFCFFVSARDDVFALTLCMALSCLGFLPFNIPKAKVFMGDVGSILLGFVFATIVVMLAQSILDFVCLASFLFPFYADESITMALRMRNKENLLAPHRKHLYQLLVNEMGIEHWKVAAGYGLLQIIVAGLVLWARSFGFMPVAGILLLCFFGFAFAFYSVRKIGLIEKSLHR